MVDISELGFEWYIEQLFKTAVGDLGVRPLDFYRMSIREVMLAIDGKNEALERDYNLMVFASFNGNGMIQGGKKFKPINPFEENKKEVKKKKPTKQDRDETLAFLKSYQR